MKLGETTSRGRALVIDDVPTTVSVLRRLLEREGYDVDVARTAHGALSMLAQPGGYTLAVVDLLLPDSPDADTDEKRARATLEMLRPALASVSDVRIYTGATGAALPSFAASLGFGYYEKGGSLPVASDPVLGELEELRRNLERLAEQVSTLPRSQPPPVEALVDAMCDRLLKRLAVADWSEIRAALEQSKQLRAHAAFAAKLIVTTFIVSMTGALIAMLTHGFRFWSRGQ